MNIRLALVFFLSSSFLFSEDCSCPTGETFVFARTEVSDISYYSLSNSDYTKYISQITELCIDSEKYLISEIIDTHENFDDYVSFSSHSFRKVFVCRDENDLDGDGITNADDDDVDGDGVPNTDDDDVDGDGVPNADDDDVDGDGVANSDDDDVDGDGIANSDDDDVDGDGVANSDDDDLDGDGIANENDFDIDGDSNNNTEIGSNDDCPTGSHYKSSTDLTCVPNCTTPELSKNGFEFQGNYKSDDSCISDINNKGSGMGFSIHNDDCPVYCYFTSECPAHSHSISKNDCKCDSGYTQQGNICTKSEIGSNDDSSVDIIASDDPKADNPEVNDPKSDDSETDNSKSDDPETDNSKSDDSKTNNPKSDDPEANDSEDNNDLSADDKAKLEEESSDLKNFVTKSVDDTIKDNIGTFTTLYSISIPRPSSCGCQDLSIDILGFHQDIKICDSLDEIFSYMRPVLWFSFLIGLLFSFLKGGYN